jgi:hypothetical protein
VTNRWALYAKAGERQTGRFTFSPEQTRELQRLMLERAFRWILATRELPWVSPARPREVNPEKFAAEREAWKQWNPMQSEAEAQFLDAEDPSTT